MTVYLGSRCTVFLNTYEVVKQAFVKKGDAFSGRPQDLYFMKEFAKGKGNEYSDMIAMVRYTSGIYCGMPGRYGL